MSKSVKTLPCSHEKGKEASTMYRHQYAPCIHPPNHRHRRNTLATTLYSMSNEIAHTRTSYRPSSFALFAFFVHLAETCDPRFTETPTATMSLTKKSQFRQKTEFAAETAPFELPETIQLRSVSRLKAVQVFPGLRHLSVARVFSIRKPRPNLAEQLTVGMPSSSRIPSL